MECCFEYIYFPSKYCTGVNISVKYFVSVKMHFQMQTPLLENFPAALPKKLPSSNISSLKNYSFACQKKAMGKE